MFAVAIISPLGCVPPTRSLKTLLGNAIPLRRSRHALQCARARICQIITFATWIRSSSVVVVVVDILLFSLSLSLSLSLSSNRETLTLSQFFKRLVAAASGRQAPYMMGLTMSPISILFHCYSWFFFIALFKTIAGILESARSQNSNVNTAVHCACNTCVGREGRQRKRESDAAAAALRCDTRGWACCASPQPSTSTGPTLTACMSPCNLCHMKINL